MVEPLPMRRKLVGSSDLVWIGAVLFTAAMVTTLLLTHLRNGFELYRLGNQLAYAAAETRALENEKRSLLLEYEYRSESLDLWEAAEEIGLRPPQAHQLVGGNSIE